MVAQIGSEPFSQLVWLIETTVVYHAMLLWEAIVFWLREQWNDWCSP